MVSQKEIIEELRGECNGFKRDMLADRIEAEGIAPPSVDALIADLMELHLTWEDYQDVKEVCDKYRSVK